MVYNENAGEYEIQSENGKVRCNSNFVNFFRIILVDLKRQ